LMTVRVTLRVVRGPIQGTEFVFEERTTCLVGRAKDCALRIPEKKGQATLSRYHCLLDINPPNIRIRDFSSLNGTYVNGEKIGQRSQGQKAGSQEWVSFREVDLKHGDKIYLGGSIIKVRISEPAPPPAHTATAPPRQARIVEVGGPQQRPCEPPPSPACTATRDSARRLCAKCGRSVEGELHHHRQGDYICAACRSDPFDLIRRMLREADSGKRELVAMKGYAISRELGRGGMGAVYLAQHEKSGRRIALKVMLPKVAADHRSTESFLRETVNTRSLRHPNIVRLHDAGCSQGTFFFTLEFCGHGSVDQLMRERGGKLPIEEATPIILQALDGLIYAHRAEIPYVRLQDGRVGKGRGLVHRDLKPQNVFLSRTRAGRTAKLGDYGLSKAFDLAGLSGHTYTGDVAGTPQFMPRQQVLDFRNAGPQVDVWAMAATLYCMLTGHPPRDFSKRKDPWQIILRSDPLPIRKRESAIPARLAEVIDHALRDKPEIGFQTAVELKQSLERVL
jgi:serine/threonine-protein kinase